MPLRPEHSFICRAAAHMKFAAKHHRSASISIFPHLPIAINFRLPNSIPTIPSFGMPFLRYWAPFAAAASDMKQKHWEFCIPSWQWFGWQIEQRTYRKHDIRLSNLRSNTWTPILPSTICVRKNSLNFVRLACGILISFSLFSSTHPPMSTSFGFDWMPHKTYWLPQTSQYLTLLPHADSRMFIIFAGFFVAVSEWRPPNIEKPEKADCNSNQYRTGI